MQEITKISGIVIAILIVTCVAIPVIDSVYDTSNQFGFVYDDYKEIDPNVNVSGVFEKVTFDGKTYAHATNVGIGSIDNIQYTVKKADLVVFVIWGQSNGMYLNADPTVVNEDFEPLKTRAYFYGISTDDAYRPIISWKDGNGNVYPENGIFLSTTNPAGEYLIGSLEAPFSAEYCNNSYNYRPYLINTAVGGWNIQQFIPGAVGNTNIHKIMDRALEQIDSTKFNVRMGAWIMSQGEANAGTPISTYIEYFDSIYNDFKESYHINNGLIIQTRSANGLNSHNAQSEIVEEYPNVYMGSTASDTFTVENGLLASDNIHYTQKGRDIVGSQTAETWLDITDPTFKSDEIVKIILLACPLFLIVGIILYIVRSGFFNKSEY